MKYLQIEDRKLTEDIKQYKNFRKENKDILNFFKKFPIFPSKLDVSFKEKWDFKRHFLYKISYFVEPHLKVNSYLMMPKIESKMPAIIAAHQHNDEFSVGKSEVVGLVKFDRRNRLIPQVPKYNFKTVRPDFAYGKELCERGYVVLAPDMLGFEEYRETDNYFEGRYRSYENIAARKYFMRGSSLICKYIHDLYVAVSVLENVNKVDKHRIGIIGHSLGGEQAIFASLFDRRIKVGVSSCGFASYVSAEKHNRYENAAWAIPRFLEYKRDFDYFIKKIKPTPFLITNGKKEVCYKGNKMVSAKAKYNGLEIINFDGGHSFPKKIRKQAHNLIDRILQ